MALAILEHPLTEQALEQGYTWAQSENGQPILRREVVGRIVIANYDPALLGNDERHRLHQEVEQYPRDNLLVDIRPGFPGGDYPMRGRIKFRSFDEILVFLARGIEEEPEFEVAPDPRSGQPPPNPTRTLEVVESLERPQNAVFTIKFRNRWYSVLEVAKDGELVRAWHLEAFSILSQLYQMTVTDITKMPALPITIAK